MSQESRSSDELGNPKLFDGLTAWFSDSIADRRKDLWVQNDGVEEEWEQARYVFSDDASAADTVRIFDSEAYLNEHLAIFHSSYIDECLRHGDMKMVALGKFILPPVDTHKGLHTKLYWEMLVEKEKQRQNQQTTARKRTPAKQTNTEQSTSSSSQKQKQQGKQQEKQRMEKRQTSSASNNTTAIPESSTRPDLQKQTTQRQTPQLSKASQRSSPRRKPLQGSSSVKKRQLVNEQHDAAEASPTRHQTQAHSPSTRSTHKHNDSPAKSPVVSKKRRKTSRSEVLSEAASDLNIEPVRAEAPGTEQFADYQWVNTLEQEDDDIEEFIIGQHGCNVKTLSAVTAVS